MLAASTNLDLSGWICFGLGAVTFVVGLVLGILIGAKHAKDPTRAQVKAKVDLAVGKVAALTAQAVGAANTGKEEPDLATAATETGAATESAVKDIEGLIKVLPARFRFAGFLMLVGAFVMSVGTVQFGGTSIF